MDKLKNFWQSYSCCCCSLRIRCIFIAIIELCYPVLLTCIIIDSTIVIAISWVLYLSSTIILLFGLIEEHPVVLLGWLIYRAVVLFFCYALVFSEFIYKINEVFDKYDEKTKLVEFFVMAMIFYFVIKVYFWTVVYNYYMELRKKQNMLDDPINISSIN